LAKGLLALEADLDVTVGDVARGFEAKGLEGERVVGAVWWSSSMKPG
jgi:hypothetical protein